MIAREYRYLLTREWDPALPRLGWIMLNPSTADDREDDATIRRCLGYSKREGFGSLIVANLYPMRATFPRDLRAASEAERLGEAGPSCFDPLEEGPNHEALAGVCVSRRVVLAWGNLPAAYRARAEAVEAFVRHRVPAPLCIGRTRSGAPRHPSRGPYVPLQEYR